MFLFRYNIFTLIVLFVVDGYYLDLSNMEFFVVSVIVLTANLSGYWERSRKAKTELDDLRRKYHR